MTEAALPLQVGRFRRNNPTGFIPEQHLRDSAATTHRMEQATPPSSAQLLF